MTAKIIAPGTRFGKLVVIGLGKSRLTPAGSHRSTSLVRCDCGNEKQVNNANLLAGGSTSCGCVRIEAVRHINLSHGKTESRAYSIWCAMLTRCNNPNNVDRWKNYGGRGITICDRWKSFENFYADMGDPPPGMSLERKEVDLGYNPDNCRWATPKEQSRNTRRNIVVAFLGARMILKDAASLAGLRYSTVTTRLRRGWSPEKALTTPVRSLKRAA